MFPPGLLHARGCWRSLKSDHFRTSPAPARARLVCRPDGTGRHADRSGSESGIFGLIWHLNPASIAFAEDARRQGRRRTTILQVLANAADSVISLFMCDSLFLQPLSSGICLIRHAERETIPACNSRKQGMVFAGNSPVPECHFRMGTNSGSFQ
ncbi:MAG: hypothetical protein DRH37_04145 [Deltaproteobacteria bacterium]|nr:MAG: hypothetical protein DRH37_04145 [Deltaproteobacteria bacterium]